MSNDIEYIEPTQEHVGQMVEVRDADGSNWSPAKLVGIASDDYKFTAKRAFDPHGICWKHARIARPLTYAERQARCGLKVGDTVRIARAYEKHEQGYWCGFFDSMKRDIGLIGTIQKFDSLSQPCVYIAESSYVWPYFVLEKVEDRRATNKDFGKTIYVDGNPADEFKMEIAYQVDSEPFRAVVRSGDKRFIYELNNLRVKE